MGAAVGVGDGTEERVELLVRAVGASTVLEVGTLGGYSTIHLARGIRPGGKVTTLELDEHHADVARANFAAASLDDRIEVIVGPAIESLGALQAAGFGPVDASMIAIAIATTTEPAPRP